MARGSRPRGRPIYVWVSDEERKEIERRANAAHMSLSAFLRTLGLGHEPRSGFDSDAVLALAKLNADQGRLGGLLKLWLTTRRGEGARPENVGELLDEIRSLQRRLAETVGFARKVVR